MSTVPLVWVTPHSLSSLVFLHCGQGHTILLLLLPEAEAQATSAINGAEQQTTQTAQHKTI